MGKLRKIKSGTITSPKGFLASGIACGIKKSGKKDLAVILSEWPAVAAALFTTNNVRAWTVLYSERAIRNPRHRAILATSGNANCLNGENGKRAVIEAIRQLSKQSGIPKSQILIAQTGIIGRPFPVDAVRKGIPEAVKRLSRAQGKAAARAILTTDVRSKEAVYETNIGARVVRAAAIAKGAGMIRPNMATMLCFITTDVSITKALLKKALRESAGVILNSLAIDNDMSTNDTVFVLANGASGAKKISRPGIDFEKFKSLLSAVCRDIARQIILGAEGGTHLAEIEIKGARSDDEALTAGRHIGTSMLVKSMFAGADPNVGRITAAVGSSGARFSPARLKVFLGSVCVFRKGEVINGNLSRARKVLLKKIYRITVDLAAGKGSSLFLATDLTKRYVEINSTYST
ncbi:MAG: bifunctional glutamate N-acetyltransferase/amino-acid acetyltransferase ArgJ [Candidatus Omnitrophica bacterium]|nr:bifunctional glutamate N-acetyltransferase/amino-acid acetyltransferase ArgJ [Candidatus Omnitrophota bacterium]